METGAAVSEGLKMLFEFTGSMVGVAIAIWGALYVERKRRKEEAEGEARSLRAALAAEIGCVRKSTLASADLAYTSFAEQAWPESILAAPSVSISVYAGNTDRIGRLGNQELLHGLVSFYDSAAAIPAAATHLRERFLRDQDTAVIFRFVRLLLPAWRIAVVLEQRLGHSVPPDELRLQAQIVEKLDRASLIALGPEGTSDERLAARRTPDGST